MPENDWDQAGNGEVAAFAPPWQEAMRARIETRNARTRERDIRNPELIIPSLDRESLAAHFLNTSFSGLALEAQWAANRIMWICHDCGCFGYKLSLPRELDRCYNGNCHSRNVTIARSGDISLAIRDLSVGIKLTDIYRFRQDRIRQNRARRRTA